MIDSARVSKKSWKRFEGYFWLLPIAFFFLFDMISGAVFELANKVPDDMDIADFPPAIFASFTACLFGAGIGLFLVFYLKARLETEDHLVILKKFRPSLCCLPMLFALTFMFGVGEFVIALEPLQRETGRPWAGFFHYELYALLSGMLVGIMLWRYLVGVDSGSTLSSDRMV